jgi:hypothetical protein
MKKVQEYLDYLNSMTYMKWSLQEYQNKVKVFRDNEMVFETHGGFMKDRIMYLESFLGGVYVGYSSAPGPAIG